jgi:hypothetical protein
MVTARKEQTEEGKEGEKEGRKRKTKERSEYHFTDLGRILSLKIN